MTSGNDSLQTEEARFRASLAEIAASDRRRGRNVMALTISMILVATAWLLFSVAKVRDLTKRAEELRATSDRLQKSIDPLRAEVSRLQSQANALSRTQGDVLDFLGSVASKESIRLVDEGVDWNRTKAYLISMPAGTRKSALLSAILLAWKNVPFSTSNKGLTRGLDSPRLINLILERYGVHVQRSHDQRLSDSMMTQFKRVTEPLPGDLIFYRGNVGSFAVMYICPGDPHGKGVAVGTLQTGEELSVLDTAEVNTPSYPFIGYFRVPYPDKTPAR